MSTLCARRIFKANFLRAFVENYGMILSEFSYYVYFKHKKNIWVFYLVSKNLTATSILRTITERVKFKLEWRKLHFFIFQFGQIKIFVVKIVSGETDIPNNIMKKKFAKFLAAMNSSRSDNVNPSVRLFVRL